MTSKVIVAALYVQFVLWVLTGNGSTHSVLEWVREERTSRNADTSTARSVIAAVVHLATILLAVCKELMALACDGLKQ